MLGINPPTASHLLDQASDLQAGDWVVQNAANSGVGRSVIPIAKARGLKTINVVRRPELIPELEAIGGDLVIVDEDGALDKVRAAVGHGAPLAIDGVAGNHLAFDDWPRTHARGSSRRGQRVAGNLSVYAGGIVVGQRGGRAQKQNF